VSSYVRARFEIARLTASTQYWCRKRKKVGYQELIGSRCRSIRQWTSDDFTRSCKERRSTSWLHLTNANFSLSDMVVARCDDSLRSFGCKGVVSRKLCPMRSSGSAWGVRRSACCERQQCELHGVQSDRIVRDCKLAVYKCLTWWPLMMSASALFARRLC
jgi:hypothetical protein